MARVIKITETSNTGLPSAYKYPRRRLRVVECEEEQRGYKSERGVIVVWESEIFTPGSRGPKSKYRTLLKDAESVARRARRCLAAGLKYNAPDYAIIDKLIEMGLALD